MSWRIAKCVVVALGLVFIMPRMACAQCPVGVGLHDHDHYHEPRIKTEWGIGVGGVYTLLDHTSSTVALAPRIGYQGNVQMALLFGRFLGLETEICYSGGSVDASLPGVDFERRVRTTTIDIPIFLSLRLFDRVHLNFGPQFTVMSRAEYTLDGETRFFGPLYPTYNVAGAVGIRLFSNLMLEARYIYALRGGLNSFLSHEFETTASRVTAGLTLTF